MQKFFFIKVHLQQQHLKETVSPDFQPMFFLIKKLPFGPVRDYLPITNMILGRFSESYSNLKSTPRCRNQSEGIKLGNF